jgi:hypothetical protein
MDETVDWDEEMITDWQLSGDYTVTDPTTYARLVEYWAAADRAVVSDTGWSGDPDGYLYADGDWGWSLRSNGAATQEDGGSLDEQVCDALPCSVSGPAGALPDVLSPFEHPSARARSPSPRRWARSWSCRAASTSSRRPTSSRLGLRRRHRRPPGSRAGGSRLRGLDLQVGDLPADSTAPSVTATADRRQLQRLVRRRRRGGALGAGRRRLGRGEREHAARRRRDHDGRRHGQRPGARQRTGPHYWAATLAGNSVFRSADLRLDDGAGAGVRHDDTVPAGTPAVDYRGGRRPYDLDAQPRTCTPPSGSAFRAAPPRCRARHRPRGNRAAAYLRSGRVSEANGAARR